MSVGTLDARARPCAELHNPGAESTKVLMTTADLEVTETKPPSEAVGVVVCVLCAASSMLAIGLLVESDVNSVLR